MMLVFAGEKSVTLFKGSFYISAEFVYPFKVPGYTADVEIVLGFKTTN